MSSQKSSAIMDAIVSKVKTVLSEAKDVLASEVTPRQAERMNEVLGEAMSAGWTEGLRTWLATAETDAETMFSILREEPPDLASTGTNAPAGAQRILDRCLCKEPASRSSTAMGTTTGMTGNATTPLTTG